MPSSLSPHVCVCCRVQDGKLPLHCAAQHYNASEAVIKALLAAYPAAVRERDEVRCGRGRRVLSPSSRTPYTCTCAPCPLPSQGHSGGGLSAGGGTPGRLPKDYARTDAIKVLLAPAYKGGKKLVDL